MLLPSLDHPLLLNHLPPNTTFLTNLQMIQTCHLQNRSDYSIPLHKKNWCYPPVPLLLILFSLQLLTCLRLRSANYRLEDPKLLWTNLLRIHETNNPDPVLQPVIKCRHEEVVLLHDHLNVILIILEFVLI